jgi:DNA-binding response OmpR family regulator
VIVTSSLDDLASDMGVFKSGRETWIVKPFSKQTLLEKMEELGLINHSESSNAK